jgi:fatty acid-binding protein DegV
LIHIDAESLSQGPFSLPQTDGLPLMSLDDGQLVPYKKIRTRRHLLESFQEFLEEFETPIQIACLHGKDSAIRPRSLRDIAAQNFPEVPFTDLEMPPALAHLFGPETVAITVMEPSR